MLGYTGPCFCSATYPGLSASKNILYKKKKKSLQQHDSAEHTSQQSCKLRRVIFGAVSCFLENTCSGSAFLFHLLNNLWPRICTKHFKSFFFPLPPEAAITEAAAADKPAGVDKDPAVARPITARQIKTTTTKKSERLLWQALTAHPMHVPPLPPARHDFTKRSARATETCHP